MTTKRKLKQTKATQPLISVIVPIYKVEKYLNRCIDSILAQDYKNLQIILVDDGSPDKCPEICNAYARQDPRVTVVHKTNGGLSDARNAGIEIAKGEYISFVDSDDYVDSKFISYLYNISQKYNADISICGYTEVYEDSGKSKVFSNSDGEVVQDNIEAMADSFVDRKVGYVFAWNKLYKSSIFFDNAIRYPKGKVLEDAFTTYKLFYYSNKIVYGGQPLYHYLKRLDGITGSTGGTDSLSHLRTRMEFLTEMDSFVHEHDLPLTKELDYSLLTISLHYIGALANAGKVDTADWDDLRTNVVDRFPRCLVNDLLPPSKKIAAVTVWLGRNPYVCVSKVLRLAKATR